LGLLRSDLNAWRRWAPAGQTVDEDEIESRIKARNAAKAAKNFAESDRIRDDLLAKGIVLKDGPQGTTWELKK
jgi:cysteinyl-tRNA synthetase